MGGLASLWMVSSKCRHLASMPQMLAEQSECECVSKRMSFYVKGFFYIFNSKMAPATLKSTLSVDNLTNWQSMSGAP